jgi:hypothetical protein
VTPEQIRAEYVETLARAAYLDWCRYRAEESTWEDCTGETRRLRLEHAEMLADALAAEGKLPTEVEGRYIGRGEQRRTRYVTEWQDPSNVSEFPNTSPLESGGQTKPMPARPNIGTSEVAE